MKIKGMLVLFLFLNPCLSYNRGDVFLLLLESALVKAECTRRARNPSTPKIINAAHTIEKPMN